MVESPNKDVGINYGHASYVYEVNYDANGKAVSFTIAEGGMGKDKITYAKFQWDAKQGHYVSEDGKRVPDMFVL
jgi:hypothetical protein